MGVRVPARTKHIYMSVGLIMKQGEFSNIFSQISKTKWGRKILEKPEVTEILFLLPLTGDWPRQC